MYVIPFDTFDEGVEIMATLSKNAEDLVDDRQRKLMDGEEHWAFFIDHGQNLAIVHIKSYQQVIEGEYPEDAPLWFDDDHKCARPWLPSEMWDGHYNRPGQEPDISDVHAARLLEIPKETFDKMWGAQCSMHVLSQDPEMLRLMLTYTALYGHIQ